MKIKKILNHNTAVVDEDGQEVILIGKGICFGKKVEDGINPAQIEKKFVMSSSELNLNLQKVLISLPLDEVDLVDQMIQNIRLSFTKKLSDSLYVSLCDHIHYALKNYQAGISIHNDLLQEISHFYPDEYKLGLACIEIISKQTDIRLPIDEAGFIAMHIINAEVENGIGTSNIRRITIVVDDVLGLISEYFRIHIDESSLTYFRLINHLKYFARKVVIDRQFDDNQKDEKLLGMLKEAYPDAYLCALNIKEFIRAKYNVDSSNEELTYLIIHIQRSIE